MKKLAFKHSATASIGVEIEIQIIDPTTFDLSASAKYLFRRVKESQLQQSFKPEVTQSMLEINSAVHMNAKSLWDELFLLRDYLLGIGGEQQVIFSGGGTHPFCIWSLGKIFPTKRFKTLSKQYRYLSKRSTVFGQHIHFGCSNAAEALYLTHAFARFVPHFIALNASSPFYQGVDTGFHSSRLHLFNAFPTSGVIPLITNWSEFCDYFHYMRHLGIIQTMKDFYWDIRPKPEFGTVEIRVCDTPLTLQTAARAAAYIQALGLYLLTEKPISPTAKLYHLYGYNQFQACRYGYEGELIDPHTDEKRSIADDMQLTIAKLAPHIPSENQVFFNSISDDIRTKTTDAVRLRRILKQVGSLPKLVKEESMYWQQKD